MKTSLKKLQKFAALKHHDKRTQKLRHQSHALDELARATQVGNPNLSFAVILARQIRKWLFYENKKSELHVIIAVLDELRPLKFRDMNDMKDCYDRLLSAAAATANSVYEFSESLKEIGDCLLEKTALNDDEESGKVLLMLGKTQLELQKFIDGYRSHIVQTITVPSESLLNELRIVEEMKKRCDDKRELYEDLLKKQKEKGKLRNSKGECFPSHQLQEARDEYDEEVNIFVFRMKSLKQGQSRSLLTQASRHHTAQMFFFKKALRSLETIEPHVRLVAEQQHIDYQFSGLKDNEHLTYDVDDDETDSDRDGDSENGSETNDHMGELSFDYRQNGPLKEVTPMRDSMELDNVDTPVSKSRREREPFPSFGRNSFSFQRDLRAVSKSAPLFPEKKLDSAEQPSRRFTAYVLPTPDETKSPTPQTRHPWHSSPLVQTKDEKVLSTIRNNYTKQPPVSEGLSFILDPSISSYAKKAKRQAFSGPLTGMPWPTNHHPIVSSVAFSGSLLRTPLPRPTSVPRLSSRSSSSSPFMSSPVISELHELPRPPPPPHSPAAATHSGPLMHKSHELSGSSTVSTLPKPPPQALLARSYSSIPSLDMALHVNSEESPKSELAESIDD